MDGQRANARARLDGSPMDTWRGVIVFLLAKLLKYSDIRFGCSHVKPFKLKGCLHCFRSDSTIKIVCSCQLSSSNPKSCSIWITEVIMHLNLDEFSLHHYIISE